MKKIFVCFAVLCSAWTWAQTEPIFYESFDKCIDEEGENYGYTGGNDNQWSGDVGTAIVIYEDNKGWTYDYANGAYQCVKVGTSRYQGWIKTPSIPCSGDVTLSFRAVPWEGDSILTLDVTGGKAEKSYFDLKKNQWNDLTVKISDVTSAITVKFSSLYKHRFFLDEVKVFPADPTAAAIRVPNVTNIDFGYMGKNYKAFSQTVSVIGENLSGNITAVLEDFDSSLFSVTPANLPAEGGQLTVTFKAGASPDLHGTYLKLRATGSKNEQVEKIILVQAEVGTLNLQGNGSKEDPYTVADRILLANNDGTVWDGTYYWVTGYVLGAVKRYNDVFDGLTFTDKTSLVLAATPDETDWNKIVTVQIGSDARAALNVVDNPELIGQQIKVQGLLLHGSDYSPLYLGKPGVRNVYYDDQYVRPDKVPSGIETPDLDSDAPMYDILGRRVGTDYHGIVIQAGKKWLK